MKNRKNPYGIGEPYFGRGWRRKKPDRKESRKAPAKKEHRIFIYTGFGGEYHLVHSVEDYPYKDKRYTFSTLNEAKEEARNIMSRLQKRGIEVKVVMDPQTLIDEKNPLSGSHPEMLPDAGKVVSLGNPRPPKGWWTKMYRGIAARYGRLGKKRISQITASIWWKLPESTRKRLIKVYDNPSKRWHEQRRDAYDKKLEETAVGSFDRTFFLGARGAEDRALGTYRKRNPTRQHAKKGIGFLGLAAIAGIAYLIWKNRSQ